MKAVPKIQQHPNQESKSGTPPYASPTKKNYSANEPRTEEEERFTGVESEYRDAVTGRGKRRRKRKQY